MAGTTPSRLRTAPVVCALACLLISLPGGSTEGKAEGRQQILQEVSQVVNIEVPVRVFRSGDFVGDLTIRDFEVWEDGVPQKIEAVYLIRKDTITRRDDTKERFRPRTERTFFLFFEVSEWDARLGDAVDDFCREVLLPRDKLIAVTPVKTYRLKEEGFELKTREAIAEELKGLIRRDAVLGSFEYRSALKDLEDIAKALNVGIAMRGDDTSAARAKALTGQGIALEGGSELDELATRYLAYLQRLETMREVNELRMMDFARLLKGTEGQTYVFLFLQREHIPMLDPKILTTAQTMLQTTGETVDLNMLLKDVTSFFNRDMSVDVKRIKQAYADASTAVHFLFITKPAPDIPGVYFAERSSDVFTPFHEMAKASGGFSDSSANPDWLFKTAVKASENTYLLYYAPSDYAGDGKFKTIKVRVKGKGLRVIHRLGYFAN